MIALNTKYMPVTARIMKGGKYTRFAIPQFHREGDKDVQDGLINVLVRGDYRFKRGDYIKILKITGANRQGNYFTLIAEIEYIAEEEYLAEPNSELLADNIPDDL